MWWCGLPGSYEVGDVLHLFVGVFRCKGEVDVRKERVDSSVAGMKWRKRRGKKGGYSR